MKKPIREFAPLSLSPFILLALLITIFGTIFLGIFPSKIIAFAQKSSILF
jgi:NADH-quinone oxidoreductase subunit N